MIIGVAKGVANGICLDDPFSTVQGVSFNAVTPVQAPNEDFKMS